jgi:uncharacterized membrane protein
VPEGAGDGQGGRHWQLRRNCALSPAQFGGVFLTLAAVSVAIATFFVVAGAPYVAVFAGIEVLALGVAFLVFARHAGDGEHIRLQDGLLRIEQRLGHRGSVTEIDAAWARVEPPSSPRALVALVGAGRRVEVGRYLTPPDRARLAHSLRQALRDALPTTGATRAGASADAFSPISDSKQA